jgi:hypothetical protein
MVVRPQFTTTFVPAKGLANEYARKVCQQLHCWLLAAEVQRRQNRLIQQLLRHTLMTVACLRTEGEGRSKARGAA